MAGRRRAPLRPLPRAVGLTAPRFGESGEERRGSTTGYGFDDAGQLTGVTVDGVTAETLTYDWSGNRDVRTGFGPTGAPVWREDYGVDVASRIDTVAHQTWSGSGWSTDTVDDYAYDAAGRRTGIDTAGVDTAYTWDASGALSGIAGAHSASWVTAPDRTIRQATVDGTTSRQLWDTAGPVASLIEASSGWLVFHANYGYRPLQVSLGDPDNPGSFFAMWLSYDHRGSVLATDAQTALPDGYDTFGRPTTTGPACRSGTAGEMHVADHLWLRNRVYDPATGSSCRPIR